MVYGHRNERGLIVSSSAIYVYGEALASIGLVIVREQCRRRGLGRAAVLKCLEQARGTPVMLVSTPDGLPLYESLGFRPVEAMQNLVAPAGARLAAGDCRTIHASDLPAVLALDRTAFGAGRRAVLENRWKQAAGGALLPDAAGFAWKVFQRDRLIIGPVIAPDEAGALQLIGNLVAGHAGTIRMDVPARHAGLIARLVAAGFERRALRPLMLKNADSLPGDRSRLFAAATLASG
jgi:hypothetical protein